MSQLKTDDTKSNTGCYKHFETFTNNTNLHGFRYITDRNLSTFERTLWGTVIISSFIGCIYLVIIAWIQWNNNRVIVSFSRTSAHICQIPFPGVTICPETRIRQTLYNSSKIVARKNEILSGQDFVIMESIAQVCDAVQFPNLKTKYVNESLVEFLRTASLPFDELFYSCEWKSRTIDCKKIFIPILTDRGVCYSFNILTDILKKDTVMNGFRNKKEKHNSRRWSLETDYRKYLPSDSYPKRGNLPGLDGGLSIVMGSSKRDIDYVCGGSFQGFRVSLLSPSNVPSMSEEYFMLPFDEQLIVSFEPNMVFTPPGLEALPASKRGCFMDTERKLKFFNTYSSTNCGLECLANYTFSICGCVGYFMPRDKSTNICGAEKLKCMKDAKMIMGERETLYALHEKSSDLDEYPEFCNCISECTSIQYEQSVSQTKSDTHGTLKAFNLTKNPKEVFVSTIRMYFNTAHFIPSKRIESFTLSQFLGNIGGTLSLFTGFSVLTFVEIIYYVVIKPTISAIKRRLEKAPKDEIENDIN